MFRPATYKCAHQQGVNVFARRFTRCPRNWTFVDECPSAAPGPAATPAAPRFLLELVGPQHLLAISDEIALIERHRHNDPNGGAQLVANDLICGLSAERRLIGRHLRPDGWDYPGRRPASLTLRQFRNRMHGDLTAKLAGVEAGSINGILKAIRDE